MVYGAPQSTDVSECIGRFSLLPLKNKNQHGGEARKTSPKRERRTLDAVENESKRKDSPLRIDRNSRLPPLRLRKKAFPLSRYGHDIDLKAILIS